MKKLFIPLAVLLVSVMIITGCSTSTPTPAATAPVTTQPAATTSAPATRPATTTAAATTAATTAPAASKPAPTTPAAGTPQYGGHMRIVYATGPGTSIGMPQEAVGGTVATEQLSLETLFREDIDGSLNPNLATSMDVAPDGSSITIHLRQGVKFHDGSDFNAQAVKWNWDQVKSIGMNNNVSDYWKSLQVIDDYTFKVNYTVWQNVALKSLGENWTYIVSPTAFAKNGIDWMRQNMVGTGPFQQKSYQRDVQYDSTKFAQYWQQGKPYLDGVQLLYVADEMTRIALFESGGADVLIGIPDALHANLASQGFNVVHQATGNLSLIPDSNDPDSPWSNLKVRQAAEYAIDKESMTAALGHGFMKPAYQLPTPYATVYDKTITPTRKYDVAKAKQLLVDAGYPNGFKTTIILAAGQIMDVSLAIQSYWSKVGINATIETPTSTRYQVYLTDGWKNAVMQMVVGEWPNYNSVWGFYFTKNSNWWPTVKKSDQLQTLINASYASIKPDVSLEQAVLNNLYADQIVIPVYYNESVFVLQPYVHDTGWLQRMFPIYWKPESAWMSAH